MWRKALAFAAVVAVVGLGASARRAAGRNSPETSPNEIASSGRIAALIEREFRVGYHPAQVSRILAQLGLSYQKPERRALQRNEAAVAHWERYRWSDIKTRRLSAHLAFLDESGFLLVPSVRRATARAPKTCAAALICTTVC